METIDLEKVVQVSNLHHSRIFNVTIFGSRIYGTFNKNSDWDVVVVANNSVEALEIKADKLNIHIYTPDRYTNDLQWHRINNLECNFAPSWAKLKQNIGFEDFQIDIKKLRHSICHASHKSLVKGRKKLEMNDYQSGIKSFFHSVRILMFGQQIVDFGRIIDYECANFIWNRLLEKNWTWSDIESEFTVFRCNTLMNFRESTK